jgi:hypothetical protein
VAEIKYLRTTINENSIHEKTTSTLSMANACCRPVQNHLPPRLLSENEKIKMYKNSHYENNTRLREMKWQKAAENCLTGNPATIIKMT